MKKIIVLVVSIMLILILSGCPGLFSKMVFNVQNATINEGDSYAIDLSTKVVGGSNPCNFTLLEGDGEIVDCVYTLQTDYSYAGEYTIKIKATDSAGKEAIAEFKVVVEDVNVKPEVELLSPEANLSEVDNELLELTWAATDFDNDSLSYDLYFGTNSEPCFFIDDLEETSFVMDNLYKGTTYYWKIVAKDEKGGETESAKWNFTTITDPENTPPDAPIKVTPELDTYVATNTTIEWSCTDPDEEDTLYYDIYFGEGVNAALIEEEATETTYDPGELIPNTLYSWKIVAKDRRGGVSTSNWSFKTVTETPVVIPLPENPSPSINATDVIWDSVTLSWDLKGDSEGLYYDIYFGKDELPGIYRIGHDATEITISNLDRGETYHWQIVVTDEPYSRAKNSESALKEKEDLALIRKDKAAATGEVWNFTTKENQNPKFISSEPISGKIDVIRTPELKWEFIDQDDEILHYDIYFGSSANPPLIRVNYSGTSLCLEELEYSTTYYWQVIAHDGFGGEISSGLNRFTTSIIMWQKSLGGSKNEVANSIQQTSDGGYIVAGYTESKDGDVSVNHDEYWSDYWIVKLTEDGSITWQKCLGGFDKERAADIEQTSDGGYIVAGYSFSYDKYASGIYENYYSSDYWIVKLTEDGSIAWQKRFGCPKNEFATDIEQTADGGYIFTGYLETFDDIIYSVSWIFKLREDGSIAWDKWFDDSYQEYAYDIEQTTDGGYIVAGFISSVTNFGNVSGSHGGYDYWIMKLKENGELDWQKYLGGSKSDVATSIEQTSDGGYIVAGYTRSNDGDVSGNDDYCSDYWIVKLTEDGSIAWQKCVGSPNVEYQATSIEQTSDGGYIVAGCSGNSSDNYWIVKLTEDGSITWQKGFGGSNSDRAYDIGQTTDGGYIVAGSTCSDDGDVSGNHGDSDYWIVKLEGD